MSATAPQAPPAGSSAVREPAVEEACPLCGGPLRSEQEWCLQCGAAARTRLAATPRWRVPVFALGMAIVLSLGALTVALVSLAGDSGSTTTMRTITVPAAATPTTSGGSTSATGPGAAATGASTPTVALPRAGSTPKVASGATGAAAAGAVRSGTTASAGAARPGSALPGTGAAGSGTHSTPGGTTPAGQATSTTPTTGGKSGGAAKKGNLLEKLAKEYERRHSQAAGAPAG